MKINFINIGCKVNFAEISRLKDMFCNLNYKTIDNPDESDIILINTCSVTNQADADSRKMIRRMRRKNPDAFIGVLGCYAQLQGNKLIAETGADAVFSINDKFNIPEIIEQKIKNRENDIGGNSYRYNIDSSIFDYAFSADNETRTRAILKLQDGCDYCCTYCTIPLARGNSRSLKFGDISQQVLHLYEVGYKEIILTGINLSDYKADTGENFYDLMALIANIDLPIRFRISSIEPQIINEKLINIVANSTNICPHFHIPLQSGSDEILKLMKRRYNSQQFANKIDLIKKYLPNACIGLDVISGFPGETDVLFHETKRLIENLDIAYLHCFSYSKRSGTPAEKFPDQVEKYIIKQRTHELLNVSDKKLNQYYRHNLGKILQFLPEKYDAQNCLTYGHTENYIPIAIAANQPLKNDFYSVELIELHNKNIFSKIV